ncbi:MAG: zinc ribbon domain-containing protein [Candidatus Lokiarchaeota archaeon]|nr:zinc ribbon domain-containing protein [Candidatus Lokiarchaeota archaeon]
MSQDKIVCPKCGRLVRKDIKHCQFCGTLLEPEPSTPSMPSLIPSQPSGSTKPPKMKKKFPYHTLTFFIIVGILDLIASYLVINGVQLPVSDFGQLFLIFFFVFTFALGIIWLAVKYIEEECAGVIVAIVVCVIGIPLLLLSTFTTIAPSIGDAINEAISDAFTEMFADVEIPGFEPLLFLGLFAMLSIIIMYRYHLKTKKNSLSN